MASMLSTKGQMWDCIQSLKAKIKMHEKEAAKQEERIDFLWGWVDNLKGKLTAAKAKQIKVHSWE